MFFVPDCDDPSCEQRPYEKTKKLIEENGGMVIDQHECFTY